MSIYNSTQICGPDSEVKAYRVNGSNMIFITVTDGRSIVTLNPEHLRQMADALAAFEAAEVEAA